MNKKTLVFIVLLLLFEGVVFAATGSLADGATEMKTEVSGWLKALKWIFALVGPAVPFLAAGWQWNKIAEAEEAKSNGQGQGSGGGTMKFFKIFGMFFAGFALMFIIFGFAAIMLTGSSFTEGWGIFVNDFWSDILL